MSIKVTTDIEISVIECANCGIPFGITALFENRRREDHETFYCPRGHNNYFPQKSDAEKLREQLAEEKRKLSNAQFELMAAEKKIKRVEKRIKNGVCPCCNRQFVQLARHIKTKHPNYTA